MATTYGYGGEFSSDEDIDRMEQQSERLMHSKFEVQTKPTKQQIDEAIETIRILPPDQDVDLTDEILAGLLDHYKTQRGPIVNSTRNLYKKIILRLVRGEQPPAQQANSNGDANLNGNVNNNNINLISKRPTDEIPSSDEDEPMPPALTQSNVDQVNRKIFDSQDDKMQPMDVDSEIPVGLVRGTRPIEMSSTEDEDSETEESSNHESSDSEVLDVTPVKSAKAQQVTLKATSLIANRPSEVVKKPAIVTDAPSPISKETVGGKKPYTRSQRVAATRASSASKDSKKTLVSSSKVTEGAYFDAIQQKPLTKKALSSKFKMSYLISALFVIFLAFFLYYLRSDLMKYADPIISRRIKF